MLLRIPPYHCYCTRRRLHRIQLYHFVGIKGYMTDVDDDEDKKIPSIVQVPLLLLLAS
jgi:hypothetical protein